MPVYLVAAYGIFWAFTFALVFSIWARQRHIEREIAAIRAQTGGAGALTGFKE